MESISKDNAIQTGGEPSFGTFVPLSGSGAVVLEPQLQTPSLSLTSGGASSSGTADSTPPVVTRSRIPPDPRETIASSFDP